MAKKPVSSIPKQKIVLDYDLTKLVEHPDNPRVLHRDGERKLAASLDEFGMLDTVVANQRDDGSVVVLGGHQRLKVLLKKGEKTGAVTLVKVSELQEKRLLVLLNGHHGKWDGEKLSDILSELQEAGDDLEALGLEGMTAAEEVMVDLEQATAADAPPTEGEGASEIDVESITMKHRCPRCGFGFDKDTAESGARDWGAKGRGKTGLKPMEDGPADDSDEDKDG